MAKRAKTTSKPKRTVSAKAVKKRKKVVRAGAKRAGTAVGKKKAVRVAAKSAGAAASKKKVAPKKITTAKASVGKKSAKRTTKAAGAAKSAGNASRGAPSTAKISRAKTSNSNGADSGPTKRKVAGKKKSPALTKATSNTDEASPSLAIVPEKPMPKTHLTPEQLDEFRLLLLAKRAELAGAVNHLSNDMTNTKGHGPSDHASMPIHMADVGSDNWEKEFTLGLIESEHERIREIDAALARIADETYGRCLETRRRINRARLRAKPWARYCIEYARAREEGRTL